ncbi:MAG TPA: HAMP domain-containing sensor histidine kinase [Verrucomicrobiae bacterium]|jgi:signal transduction histidine kinase
MPPNKSQEPNPEKLEKENVRLRGDLLTLGRRVTHDLRTPLGGIAISVELLKELFAKNDDAKGALQSLESSVDEISRLIKSMSVLAKATAQPPPLEKVAMGEIVWVVIQQLERRALKCGATVTAPEAWPQVAGHPGLLEFIWWNLLANALQHGGLTIRLDWSKEKDHFRFWVHDNGQGVTEETRALLFQPFDTLHQTNSTRGLGLSIVRRLVDLQNGRCGYEAHADGGPCFFFELPEMKG